MKKALVLLSGGIDSTVCLALAIKNHKKENVTTLCINYGQHNKKELEHAKKICEYYQVPYNEVDITNIYKNSKSSMIETSNTEIPKESYDEQYKKLEKNENVSTNVPFRNGIFLSICAGFAIENNADLIYYGIHTEEGIARSLYPDCDEDFNQAMNLAIYLGSGKKVKITAPLSEIYKKDVIKLGKKLKVPFDLTWTCYENKEKHCGKCTACTDRIKAFKENKIRDEVSYEEMYW